MSPDETHALLHEVWLRVHVERFSPGAVDSHYAGIQRAETVIHQIANERGIGWRELRATAAQRTPPTPETPAERVQGEAGEVAE